MRLIRGAAALDEGGEFPLRVTEKRRSKIAPPAACEDGASEASA
jgi:hypothetical protein